MDHGLWTIDQKNMNLQLFINDQLADLSDDSPMALTFQINNLAEVKNQQGNTSNQFKLPLTQRNRRILGFPDEVASTSNNPYLQYQAKVVQNGLEIIPYGIAELNGIEQDTASVTILSGNVDFFDALEGKLYDMGDKTTTVGATQPFNTYEHSWTLQNVVASQTKTDGWIWPVVDYGTIDYNPASNQQVIDVRNMRPGFFLKTAIEAMAKCAGYKIEPGCFLMQDELFQRLIVQFANSSFDHGADYQSVSDADGMQVTLMQDFRREHPNANNPDGFITWTDTTGSSKHFLGGFVYDAPNEISVTVTLNIPEFYLWGRVTSKHPSAVVISIMMSDLNPGGGVVPVTSKTFDFSAGFDDVADGSGGNRKSPTTIKRSTLTQDIEIPARHQLAIGYSFQGDTPSLFSIKAGATWEVKTNKTAVKYQQQVQPERIFPDIAIKDLLKDTLQRFGIVCQTDNATRMVNFASFRDIVNNIPRGIDWSAKCLDQGKAISFQLGGYAQVNTIKYKDDDSVLPKGFADSQINVADKTLPATTDLFESQFAPTLNTPFYNGTLAQIVMNAPDAESFDFSTGVTPRLLINEQTDLRSKGQGKTIRFTDGNTTGPDVVVNGIISTPYFYKPDGQHSLCFADTGGQPGLKNIYYPELEKILKQGKKVVRYFLLTPRDILELDLLIPIYLQQDGCYYYINKIDSWRAGQPTKVELVKLG